MIVYTLTLNVHCLSLSEWEDNFSAIAQGKCREILKHYCV